MTYTSTPIYYVNGSPHLGHAHTSVMADIIARHERLLGERTLLTTGCDEHGQKNQAAAEAAGLEPQAYLDERSAEFRRVFDMLHVAYDVFVRTSREGHMAAVAEVATRLQAEGHLVKRQYTGIYCTGCEQFKRDGDLTEDGLCPEHPSLTPEELDETNYFLEIEPFRQRLLDHIEADPGFVAPARYRNELGNMLAQPLEPLCISRPKRRVSLGVTLPFDEDYVAYVWFDALINYISNVGWPEPGYEAWWGSAQHLIGKDILKTHGVYWPIMLMALGLPLPRRLVVHGHWLGAGGVKMSKTLGNVVNPVEVVERLGPDALRWFLARHGRVDADSQISAELIETAYNAELANKLGNLLSRAGKFVHSRFEGRVPDPEALEPADESLRASVLEAARGMAEPLELMDLAPRMARLVASADELNEYFTAQAPWTLVKSPETAGRARTALQVSLDALRLLFEALVPVIPASSARALAMLASPLPEGEAWIPRLDRLAGGTPLGMVETLFPRV